MTNQDESLLCIDLGTSSVKSCVFLRRSDGSLDLRGYHSLVQERGNLQGGAVIQLARTIRCVQECVKKAENMARISPQQLVLGVSGEVVRGMSSSLSFERPRAEKPIEDQEQKTIIYELAWQAFDVARKTLADELSIEESDLKLLNTSIVKAGIDGKSCSELLGETGKKVDLDIFTCFSPLQHFGHLHTITAELGIRTLLGVFINSFAITSSLLRQKNIREALVIDVGGGTTNIGVIMDGKIIGTRSFALGGDTFTKRISHELSTSFEEAEDIKISYSQGSLEKKSNKVIEEALSSDLEIFLSSLLFSLKEFQVKKIPNKIFLCGEGSELMHLDRLLTSHPWTKHFPCDGEMQVAHLDYQDILPHESLSNAFEKSYLPIVGVAATAYDLLLSHNSFEEILKGVMGDKM